MLNYRDGIHIDNEIVDKLQILNVETNKKVSSGLIRGLVGKWFGHSVWISTLQSAKSNYAYICKLTYRDGTCSTVCLDTPTFQLISTCVNIQR